jgi:CheY-like chemotaxis protein
MTVQTSRRRRILIVEDNLDALEALHAWLTARGCEVRVASSGRAALQITEGFEPEVLITDYCLQDELTGVEVIAQLRARGLKAHYVLVTGMLQNALREGVRRINGVTILTKPFDYARMSELLATSEAERGKPRRNTG